MPKHSQEHPFLVDRNGAHTSSFGPSLVSLRLLSRPVRVYDLSLLLTPHRERDGQVHSRISRHEAAVVTRVQRQLRPGSNPDIESPQDPHDSNTE